MFVAHLLDTITCWTFLQQHRRSPSPCFCDLSCDPAGPTLCRDFSDATLQQGEPLNDTRVLQALCNAVISASVEKDEDNKDALKLLADLLAQDAVDPNAGDEAMWDIVRRQTDEQRDPRLHYFALLLCMHMSAFRVHTFILLHM